MYAGALFIQQALHWDLYIAVVCLLAITAVYTVAGTWLSFRSYHRSCLMSRVRSRNAPCILVLVIGVLRFPYNLFLL